MEAKTFKEPFASVLLILVLSIFLMVSEGDLYAGKIPEVEMNLSSGAFLDHLPFDSHFIIKGKITSQVKKVTVMSRKMRSPGDKKEYSAATRNQWVGLTPWKRIPGDNEKAGYFYVFFDSFLEPHNSYQFYFSYETDLAEGKATAIMNRVRQALDEKLKGNDVSEYQVLSQIRKGVLEELKKLEIAGEFKFHFPPSSIFYEGIDADKAIREMLDDLGILGKVDDLGMKREDKIDEFERDREQYADSLEKNYFHNLVLEKVLSLIKKNIEREKTKAENKRDPDKIKSFEKMEKLLGLLSSLDQRTAKLVLSGELEFNEGLTGMESPPIVELNGSWDETVLETARQKIQTTRNSFAEIKRFLNEIKADREFLSQDAPPLEKKDIQDLISRLEDTQKKLWVMVNHLDSLTFILKKRTAFIDELVTKIQLKLENDVTAIGSTYGDLSTRARWYFSSDIGIAYAFKNKEILPYYGVNIYLRPVNRDLPLRQLREIPHYQGKPLKKLGYRFSFLVGVTKDSIEDDGKREGIIGTKAILAGMGLRLSDMVKLNGGSLLYYDLTPDPLNEAKRDGIGYSIFVSLSVDWNIEKTINSLIKLVTD